MMGNNKLFSAEEAAQKLGVSVSTVRFWRFKGYLPAIKLVGAVRFREDDLDRISRDGLSKVQPPASTGEAH
jgi:excisionase family DNA binding protein